MIEYKISFLYDNLYNDMLNKILNYTNVLSMLLLRRNLSLMYLVVLY